MNNLIIEKTHSTPGIVFDTETGVLEIKGESFPENVPKFYGPVIEWIKDFLNSTDKEIVFNFEISYFNSSSSKILMNIFDYLEQQVSEGKNISVIWRCDHENESAVECGYEFKEDLDLLPFVVEIY